MSLTPEEFAAVMNEALRTDKNKHEDESHSHQRGDAVMCELLRSLGYDEGIDLFLESGRWYE